MISTLDFPTKHEYIREYIMTGIKRSKLIDFLLANADTSRETKKSGEDKAEQ